MNAKLKSFIKIGIITLLILLLGFAMLSVPAVVVAKRAANKMACRSNLKGLWLSIHEYRNRDEAKINYENLPFFGDKSTGEEYWNWRIMFILRNTRNLAFRLDELWDSEYNLPLVKEIQYPSHYFFCHADQQKEKSCYVAVTGLGTYWTEMQNGNLFGSYDDYSDMIFIIETIEPKNHWAEPGDDITPEEVIRLFEADPGLVKNSKQKWWDISHWPKNYVTAIGEVKSFDTIKDVEELRKLLIVSPEQIEAVRKKVEARERHLGSDNGNL